MLQKANKALTSHWRKSEKMLNAFKNASIPSFLSECFFTYIKNVMLLYQQAPYMHKKISISHLIHDTDQK